MSTPDTTGRGSVAPDNDPRPWPATDTDTDTDQPFSGRLDDVVEQAARPAETLNRRGLNRLEAAVNEFRGTPAAAKVRRGMTIARWIGVGVTLVLLAAVIATFLALKASTSAPSTTGGATVSIAPPPAATTTAPAKTVPADPALQVQAFLAVPGMLQKVQASGPMPLPTWDNNQLLLWYGQVVQGLCQQYVGTEYFTTVVGGFALQGSQLYRDLVSGRNCGQQPFTWSLRAEGVGAGQTRRSLSVQYNYMPNAPLRSAVFQFTVDPTSGLAWPVVISP